MPLLLKETLTYRSVKSRRTRISLHVRMIFLDMYTTATTLQMQLPTDSGRPYRRSGLSFFLSTTSRCRSVGNGLKFFATSTPLLFSVQPRMALSRNQFLTQPNHPQMSLQTGLQAHNPQAPFRPGALSVLTRLRTDLFVSLGGGLCACSRFGQRHSNGHCRLVNTIPALASLSCTSISS